MGRLATVLAVCAALGFAGCGDDDEEQPASQAPAATETTPAASSDDASGAAVTVTMKDFAFTPQTAKVEVGQEVRFVNEDSAPHDATQQGGDEELKTKQLEQGDSDTFTPTKPGTISYICTIHPNMQATLEVGS